MVRPAAVTVNALLATAREASGDLEVSRALARGDRSTAQLTPVLYVGNANAASMASTLSVRLTGSGKAVGVPVVERISWHDAG